MDPVNVPVKFEVRNWPEIIAIEVLVGFANHNLME